MPSARIVTMDGAEVGTIDLNASIFDAPLNPTLIHQVVTAFLSAQRQGNAETKRRSEVSGSTRKPYRQKGTGNARHGSIREPQMRGGGVVFGPHKRSYRKAVTVRERRQALCSALSDRCRTGALCVLQSLSMEQPKTKAFAMMTSRIVPQAKKTLYVTADTDPTVLLSSRNIRTVTVRRAVDLNTVDVMNASHIVIVQNALPVLEQRLQCGSVEETDT